MLNITNYQRNANEVSPSTGQNGHHQKLYKQYGTSLVAQWLRLQAPNAGGLGLIPGQGTRSRMPQLRPGAAK